MSRAALVLTIIALAGCARSTGDLEQRAPANPLTESSGRRPVIATTQPANPIRDSIARGVKFLVETQNPDGSWGTGLETRGLEVYSMVPGTHDAMRVATTALCVMALREAGERAAHARGVAYLTSSGEARRDMGPLLYNIWAHTYVVQALSVELRENPDHTSLRSAILWHLDRLQRYETFVGGWNYYDFVAETQRPSMLPTSFGTAAALGALREAVDAGIDVPADLSGRAIRRLEEQRLPDGAYLYSLGHRYRPRIDPNRIRGSVGRTQAGNCGLWVWGSDQVGEREVLDGLEMFFDEHAYIEMGRKRPYPHESWYATAPYYYYFGHYYAARLIEKLGSAGRERYGAKLAEKIVPHQEPDGSWWDYAMWDYHKPYGTAFAIMTLLRCDAEAGN